MKNERTKIGHNNGRKQFVQVQAHNKRNEQFNVDKIHKY